MVNSSADWDRWKNPLGEVIDTCSILTTTPNAPLA
jgi:putative SOS response-associated peptidase YedK